MITLNLNNTTITLNTHEVEGKTLYKAQDLLIGYGLDSAKTKQKIQDWKEAMKLKGGNFLPFSTKGRNGGYLPN